MRDPRPYTVPRLANELHNYPTRNRGIERTNSYRFLIPWICKRHQTIFQLLQQSFAPGDIPFSGWNLLRRYTRIIRSSYSYTLKPWYTIKSCLWERCNGIGCHCCYQVMSCHIDDESIAEGEMRNRMPSRISHSLAWQTIRVQDTADSCWGLENSTPSHLGGSVSKILRRHVLIASEVIADNFILFWTFFALIPLTWLYSSVKKFSMANFHTRVRIKIKKVIYYSF